MIWHTGFSSTWLLKSAKRILAKVTWSWRELYRPCCVKMCPLQVLDLLLVRAHQKYWPKQRAWNIWRGATSFWGPHHCRFFWYKLWTMWLLRGCFANFTRQQNNHIDMIYVITYYIIVGISIVFLKYSSLPLTCSHEHLLPDSRSPVMWSFQFCPGTKWQWPPVQRFGPPRCHPSYNNPTGWTVRPQYPSQWIKQPYLVVVGQLPATREKNL